MPDLLFTAVERRYNGQVISFLENGANVNSRDERGRTPLHVAAEYWQNKELVRILLDYGADIEAKIHGKNLFETYTPLHMAVKTECQDIVEILLERGANVNALNIDGQTPLTIATYLLHYRIAELLIKHGADINIPIILDEEIYLRLVCHFRPRRGSNINLLNLLLSKGARLEVRTNSENFTPLHNVIVKHEFLAGCATGPENSPDLCATPEHHYLRLEVKFLLHNGANIEALTKNKKTPLHLALERKFECVAEILLQSGADVHICNNFGQAPLHRAIKNGMSKAARSLMKRGAEVNATDKDHCTPLSLACQYIRDLEFINLLLDRGADIEAEMIKSLHVAAQYGNLEAARALLLRGVKVNSMLHGKAPLNVACEHGQTKMMKFLLAELSPKHGLIHSVVSSRILSHEKISQTLNCLLEHGADIDLPDSEGFTALMLHVRGPFTRSLRLLLDGGADINIESPDGSTAIDIASKLKRYEPETLKMMGQHIVKLRLAGFYVNCKNLDEVFDGRWSREKYGSQWLFFEALRQELFMMRSCTICAPLTLYDILTARNPRYTLDGTLLNSLRSLNYEQFTHYGSMIKSKLRGDQVRFKLIMAVRDKSQQLCQGKDRIFPTVLPPEIMEEILSHLSLHELKKLIPFVDGL